MAGNILFGTVSYLHHNVNENNISLPKTNLQSGTKITIDINHKKGSAHEINIKVTQGYYLKPNNDLVLEIVSISKFRIEPYSESFFKKPASIDLINIMTDLSKIAAAHNSGMFCIIKEDYNLDQLTIAPIPMQELKSIIYNDVNRQLFN